MALDLQRLLGSLGGLSALTGSQHPRGPSGPPPGPDPDLTGPALERYWNQQADQMDVADRRHGEETLQSIGAGGNISAAIDQHRANVLTEGNQLRMRGMPDWRAALASLSGKKVSGFGESGFQEGRIAPGTSDVIEPVGRSYSNAEIDDSTRDPQSPTGFAQGSMANRTGLSTQALRLLSQGR